MMKGVCWHALRACVNMMRITALFTAEILPLSQLWGVSCIPGILMQRLRRREEPTSVKGNHWKVKAEHNLKRQCFLFRNYWINQSGHYNRGSAFVVTATISCSMKSWPVFLWVPHSLTRASLFPSSLEGLVSLRRSPPVIFHWASRSDLLNLHFGRICINTQPYQIPPQRE